MTAEQYEVASELGILFAGHDGVKLLGDLYLPVGLSLAPVVIGIHGGGWQQGDRGFYRHWGNYLAGNGSAVFAIDYRLMRPDVGIWPGVVSDCKAAVQFIRAKGAEFGLDPNRIALMGDSAGAHLAALVALAADEPLFHKQYRDGPHAAEPASVKAVIGVYGVYDMAAQWEHDLLARPRDPITEKLLGCPLSVSRRVFFEASPLSYATADKNSTRFLLVWGREDDIVDPATQSERFLLALKQAGFFARTVVVPGAGHFWCSEPIGEAGSFAAYTAPRILRFLQAAL